MGLEGVEFPRVGRHSVTGYGIKGWFGSINMTSAQTAISQVNNSPRRLGWNR